MRSDVHQSLCTTFLWLKQTRTKRGKNCFIGHFPPPYSRHYGASAVSVWRYSLAIFMWKCNLYYWSAWNQVKKACFFGGGGYFVWRSSCFHVSWNRVKRVLCVKTCQNSVSLETKLFLRLQAFHTHINSVLCHWKQMFENSFQDEDIQYLK